MPLLLAEKLDRGHCTIITMVIVQYRYIPVYCMILWYLKIIRDMEIFQQYNINHQIRIHKCSSIMVILI